MKHMYLKCIKAQGFKSFADKIEIDFCDGINGIVGPNGSGKSNIVDAIRWVLGEQSVKSLRGEGAMTDVIFSGSKTRGALGSASVTLVFDNTDKYLPLDYTEVSIKRKVYKDGSNEYFINQEKCRLKDIVDILLDSGIAKESFSIISQGKIEEILSNKPTDRRVVFEEVAGVLKYKRRKEEALRKLEKTHDNMNRADDIIKELELQVGPLKEQKEKALQYKQYQKELEDIEIALITDDITTLSEQYEKNKEKITVLNNELLSLTTTNATKEAETSSFKLKLAKLEEELNEKQKSFIEMTTTVEKINSQKEILLERKKYEVEDGKLHNELLRQKEEELLCQNEIASLENELLLRHKENEKIKQQLHTYMTSIEQKKEEKQKVEKNLSATLLQKKKTEIDISSLRENLETNHMLPFAVKTVLDNKRLTGIHTILGNLIDVEEKYSTAIANVLGASVNYIVTDDEESAKRAIQFLKQNKSGRVTFLPLTTILPRFVDKEVIDVVQIEKGFIALASEIVHFDPKYKNIIARELGNVLVVDTIDNANVISKKIRFRYRIVTLDGELINVGGSITGGASKTSSLIEQKYLLEKALKTEEDLLKQIEKLENDSNTIDYDLKALEDSYYLKNKEKLEGEEYIRNRLSTKNELEKRLENLQNSTLGIHQLLDQTLIEEEEKILKSYYQAVLEKDKLNQAIEELKQEKQELNETLEEYDHELKQKNATYNAKSKELKSLEIEVNRLDVKLDMLLSTLNETYTLTYEKTKNEYFLTMEKDEAQRKVATLKNNLKCLGTVNLNAPEEYEKVSGRYEFLIHQKEDLLQAENVLLEIIQEMDEVMKKEFIQSFEEIRLKFNETFQELFKGGYADLKLSDPSNLLETGIEIIASPPGKKLTTISLLSGGEKTFTVISLLFAILQIRQIPFCIFDEVESALDEANVNSFGEYLGKLKDKTQFIIITHKKKTMEYVDVLYGITMQESGVSKLVSVRLEEMQKA